MSAGAVLKFQQLSGKDIIANTTMETGIKEDNLIKIAQHSTTLETKLRKDRWLNKN